MVAVGKKSTQDVVKPIQKDIMKDRTVTDKYWIYLFVVILLIWIGACFYVTSNKSQLEVVGRNDFLCDLNAIVENFLTQSVFYLPRLEEHSRESGSIVLYLNLIFYISIFFFATFAILVKTNHKYCGHCFVICVGMQITSLAYRGVMYFTTSSSLSAILPWKDEFLCWVIPDLITFVICIILILVVGMRKGMHFAAKKIIKARRFFSFHTVTLIFGILISMMIGCLITYTFKTISGVSTKNVTLPLPMTVLIGSSYLLLLQYYFGVAVISLTTANSFWKQDEKKISFKDISRSMDVVCRYHFGTICFNATGILPLFVAIAAFIGSVIRTIRTKSGFAKKYFMMLFFFFVGEYSTIITAMDGKNFNDATHRFLYLPIEARRVLANHFRESLVIYVTIGAITFSANGLMLILKWKYSEDDPDFTEVAIFAYATIFDLFMPVALIFDVVMDTILFCEVEKNVAINKASKDVLVELPTEVTVDKKSIDCSK